MKGFRLFLAAALLGACTPLLGACNGPSITDGPSAPPPEPRDEGPVLGEPPTPTETVDDPRDPGGGLADRDGDGYIDVIDPSGTLDPVWQERLGERVVDYSAALRTASLRLRGVLPSLLEIRYVERAADPRVAYGQLIDEFMNDPRLTERLIEFFRDTFRMGGGMLDSAPVFAAQLVVEDRPFTEIFTASSGTCPTYDGATHTFRPADCANGVTVHAGLLTHPGVMQHFYSNLAFRRVRWVQEVFACSPFPAEIGMPRDVGGAAPYTAPWPWESISGADNGGRIDFHDTSSVICANCHATMNHIAPLFANFDENGVFRPEIQVRLPLDGSPVAVRTDWLPEGEPTAWRFGERADDLPALGRALAADEDVARCIVTRVWNWAMGHGDVVARADVVPPEVIEPLVRGYVSGGYRLRATIRAIFTSDDFVRF
jgi:hypothetical protein